MFLTLVSRAAAALLLGGSAVQALQVDLTSARMLIWRIVYAHMADAVDRIDQGYCGDDSIRHDDILQGKPERRNNWSPAWSSAKSELGM